MPVDLDFWLRQHAAAREGDDPAATRDKFVTDFEAACHKAAFPLVYDAGVDGAPQAVYGLVRAAQQIWDDVGTRAHRLCWHWGTGVRVEHGRYNWSTGVFTADFTRTWQNQHRDNRHGYYHELADLISLVVNELHRCELAASL